MEIVGGAVGAHVGEGVSGLEPAKAAASSVSASLSSSGSGDALSRAYEKAVEATGAADSGEAGEHGAEERGDDVVDRASTELRGRDDPVVGAASAPVEGSSLSAGKGSLSPASGDVEILRRHKEAFLDSVVSGGRYVEEFRIFGGRMSVRVRSRTNAETDALESYLRRQIALSAVSYESEYSSLTRRLLMVAQVAEVDGVEYPEMAAPLKYVETPEGLTPPAWEPSLGMWASKPDAVVAAISGCIMEFEARYWKMISMSRDENFWLSGESTGE